MAKSNQMALKIEEKRNAEVKETRAVRSAQPKGICSFRRLVVCYVVMLHVITALLLFLEDEECVGNAKQLRVSNKE